MTKFSGNSSEAVLKATASTIHYKFPRLTGFFFGSAAPTYEAAKYEFHGQQFNNVRGWRFYGPDSKRGGLAFIPRTWRAATTFEIPVNEFNEVCDTMVPAVAIAVGDLILSAAIPDGRKMLEEARHIGEPFRVGMRVGPGEFLGAVGMLDITSPKDPRWVNMPNADVRWDQSDPNKDLIPATELSTFGITIV